MRVYYNTLLVQHRMHLDLTQEEYALLLWTTPEIIVDMENGHRRLPPIVERRLKKYGIVLKRLRTLQLKRRVIRGHSVLGARRGDRWRDRSVETHSEARRWIRYAAQSGGMELEEIGQVLGVRRQAVEQEINRALFKLKTNSLAQAAQDDLLLDHEKDSRPSRPVSGMWSRAHL